jgi:perosamine synthetase
MTIIPYGKHFLDESDIEAVTTVLRNSPLTQGPKVAELERAFSKYVNSKYAVAVSSCTAGLHIASIAAGLKNGDVLVTSPITFVASANAGLYVGADVAFADIDPQTINMDPASLAACLDKKQNTKVVIPVHFGGLPCDMEAIKAVCDQSNAAIIEDAAHALGSVYKNGRMVGSCCYSLMTVFSLHPVKSIAAGEGGVITTNDESIYRRLLRLRSHGINKGDDQFICLDESMSSSGPNSWYYEMQELGFHYRITDIQCALAISQLNKLTTFVSRRKEIATRYFEAFADSDILAPAQPRDILTCSALHLFVLRVNFQKLRIDKALLMRLLRDMKIITQVHYLPVPMHPVYRETSTDSHEYHNSLNYYRECLSIPIYYSLTPNEQEYVIATISEIVNREAL